MTDGVRVGLAQRVVTTSTPVTQTMLTRYADDLRWGRLKIRMAWYRRDGVVTRCGSFLAVTPNFVRHHNEGQFPDLTDLTIPTGHTTTVTSDLVINATGDVVLDGDLIAAMSDGDGYNITVRAEGDLDISGIVQAAATL